VGHPNVDLSVHCKVTKSILRGHFVISPVKNVSEIRVLTECRMNERNMEKL